MTKKHIINTIFVITFGILLYGMLKWYNLYKCRFRNTYGTKYYWISKDNDTIYICKDIGTRKERRKLIYENGAYKEKYPFIDITILSKDTNLDSIYDGVITCKHIKIKKLDNDCYASYIYDIKIEEKLEEIFIYDNNYNIKSIYSNECFIYKPQDEKKWRV